MIHPLPQRWVDRGQEARFAVVYGCTLFNRPRQRAREIGIRRSRRPLSRPAGISALSRQPTDANPPAGFRAASPWLLQAPSLLLVLSAGGLAVGLALRFSAYRDWSFLVFTLTVLPVLLALLVQIVASLRRGEVGLDIVAALSMSAALIFDEQLAAAVVALMYAGGQYLESFAARRARREMTALLSRVPRTARRHRNGGLRGDSTRSGAPR